MPVRRVHVHEAEADHEQDDRHLDEDDEVVERADSLMPITSSAVMQQRQENRRNVDDSLNRRQASAARCECVAHDLIGRGRDAQVRSHEVVRSNHSKRRLRILIRNVQAELVQERSEVSAPADRHRRGAEQILEDQIPADDPGDELAERRVAVGVRAAGDRDHRRELGVAESGEQTAETGEDERVDDGRSGVLRRGGAGQDEDAGADDGADAEHREVERAERSPQRPLFAFPARFSLKSAILFRDPRPM